MASEQVNPWDEKCPQCDEPAQTFEMFCCSGYCGLRFMTPRFRPTEAAPEIAEAIEVFEKLLPQALPGYLKIEHDAASDFWHNYAVKLCALAAESPDALAAIVTAAEPRQNEKEPAHTPMVELQLRYFAYTEAVAEDVVGDTTGTLERRNEALGFLLEAVRAALTAAFEEGPDDE